MRSKTLCALAVTAGTLAAVPAASAAAPPANDAFETPAVLGDAPVEGTVDEATTQPGEPANGYQTVWYLYRPSVSGRVAIEVSKESGMHGQVGVYTGSTLPELQRVGRAPTRVAFDAVSGQAYRISLGSGFTTTDGTFVLRLRPAPLPRNDAFSNARNLRIPGVYRGNLSDATAELGESERHSHSLWYRIRPRRTVDLTIDVSAPRCYGSQRMSLYTGSRLSNLRRIGTGSTIRLKAQRGRVYRLAVDCRTPVLGDFVLSLSDGSIKGKGVKLAVDAGQTVGSVRENGLRMKVSTRRRVGVGIDLRVSRATARDLGLETRVLGRTTGAVDYGTSLPAVLRLSRAARRALADVEHLKATVRLEILRTDAPNRVLTVPVRL